MVTLRGAHTATVIEFSARGENVSNIIKKDCITEQNNGRCQLSHHFLDFNASTLGLWLVILCLETWRNSLTGGED